MNGQLAAFTQQNGAYVRAVGQIELVFTFIASVVFFKEKTTPSSSSASRSFWPRS